ncbi:histone-lysine N-methyltransferase 2A-like isoform X2 [Coregonus clupeaformis]|uniref:histone-lysine N-methyltransferase 2A-like isoform X2 n=1 Tax=Coregonus clupeaformis TaxID=59861 RepID=UPI001E1C89B6|nr:histone-lysine N-methyltransferase 2A-like isoform X2 [Coregonus clupeaformis]
MAHSCRWRFPARPGGSSNLGTGRRAGRIRVSASLRSGTGTHPNTPGLRPGFDAALQVSSAIGCNLQTFRDVLGESSGSSSGEEGTFGGFGTVSEHRRIRSPSRTLAVTPTQEKKPRGRPPRAQTARKGAAGAGPSPSSASGKPEGQERPAEKAKRLPGRPPGSGEKRRGRPPASGTQRSWQARSHAANDNDSRQAGQEHGSTAAHRKDRAEDKKERKATKRTPLGSVQQQHDTEAKPPKASRESKVTKLKRLREVKLSPLKSRLKAIARKCVPVPGVPRRRRGRPPSAERLKAEAAAAAQASGSDETKQKAFRVRRDGDTDPHTPQQQSKLRVSHVAEEDDSPDVHSSSPPSSPLASSSPSKLGRPLNLRTSPRHIKPVRIVPPSKRTDAAIAKQLLQRAKKGAQKKKLLEKEAVAIGGQGGAGMETGIRRRRRTQLKNIRQFIMPVVSTVSLRIIKTPKRFIEDEGSFGAPHPHMKMARFDAVPPPVAAPQPASASSPIRASTAAVTTAAATAVTAAPVDTLPPPAAVTTSSATAVGASLLNNRCNNSTSNGRFSSSAASCGSSAMSQHSSQSSRSSSPSLDDSSCDSQASEGTQALSEPEDEHDDERDHSQGEREGDLLHTSRPPSEPEQEQRVLIERGRRGRRGQGVGRGSLGARGRGSLATGGKKAIISPATGVLMSNSQQAASTASSSSSSPPPPPLLSPPQQAQSGSNTVEHHPHSPWILPHPFLQGPSLVLSSLQDKRRSILREPTFRWTSRSRTEQQYFSSAKYAKEGLIRKPIFDNFRPPPLTAQDVGLMPHGAGGVAPAGYPTPGSGGGSGAGTRLFSPLHHHHQQHPSSRFESTLQKRSPLLRAPRFTPSEAHSRIFESVTLQSSSGSSPGSLSPLQSSPKSGRSVRRRRRKTLGPLRGQPRSPSHSMTTRSSQPGAPPGKGPSELCVLTGSVSTGAISTSNSSSSLPTSALTPAHFSTFSPGPLGLSTQGPSSSCDGHRAAGSLGGGAGGNSSSSQLFPLFTSSPQETGRGAGKGGRERSTSASRDSAPVREMERETEKSREREKENKREGRKDWERRGKASTPDASPNTTPSLFAVEGREGEEALTSLAPKKTPGRKKSASVDSGTETAPVDRAVVHSIPLILTKGRLSKKTRPSERGPEAEPGEKEKKSAPAQQTGLPPGQTGSKKPLAAPSLGSMLAHAEKLPVADKRVAGLLKKAKAQLFKIEKSKSLKSPDHPKVQSQESDSSETSVRGPRIKHVCRRAAVALGRNRAVFPDDMPTLSALPWEEREKILSSMGNDDKSSVAGSEEAEPQSPPIKPVMRHTKTIQEGGAAPRKGRRSRRCGQCPGCQVPEDCGVCTNCLDKPKFGGRNIKKQCCKVRKCQNLQWMPSKIFLQKQVKGKKDKKKNKLSEKKEAVPPVKDPTSTEPSLKPTPPPLKEEPPRKKSETPPPKSGEEKQKQPPPLLPPLQSPPADNPTAQNDQPPKTPSGATAPGHDQKHPETVPTGAASKKERKPQQPTPPSSPSSSSSLQSSPSPPTPLQPPQQQQQRPQPTQGPAKKEGGAPKSPPTEAKRKPQQQCLATPITDTAPEGKQMRKPTPRSVPPPPKPTKPKEKQQKPLATKPESSTLNLLSTPSTGGTAKQKVPSDGVHRIRVDFKKDHDVENVWATGGLSLLTSVPITPRVVCFLCASSGNVEFVFCQVCCEPFHLFCLGETERPLEEQWENWCCRRCRFCHTCGRQHQKTKQLLECEKCRNSYHPECLGPNHPTRPTKKKRVWICTKCVRCKSCGATKPGKAWDAQWSHDFSLCHDCAKLFAKGNFCPLCDKCYDEDDYESKMMQCGRCDHWVHSKCENLTDEMYELLSKLPESVAYTCTNCTKRQPAEWRTALEKELQGLVRQVLTALLNSRTSTHLLRYRQAVMKPPELNPETEESLPSRRSPEGPDPPVLTEVTPPNDSPLDLESVEKKLAAGRYKSVLEFSDDIVKIIQTAINSDGGQPENRKANSMVKSFFIRQMERVFPWFKVKESRFWETHKFSNNSGLLPNAVLPPSLDHNYAQWQEREEIARAEQPLRKKIIPAPCPKTPGEPDFPTSPPPPRPLLPPPPPMLHDLSREDSPELLPPPGISDNRQCALCLKYGDDNINEGGRLLYIGQNEWTHVNCALWSAEVFEDDDGSLKNVHMAVIRGKQLRCENCQRPGATVGCCLTSCTRNYHFMCARQRHCVFLEDKKVYCQRHRDLIKGEVVSESGFEVTRRILVDLEGISLRRKFLTGLQPENIHMMIGSMTIDCLGILTELSDCERKLFPIGYQCSRVYWSTLDARKRCVYTCRILVCRPTLVEPDLKSALPEENRTISHSPFTPISDKVLSPVPGPFDSLKPSDRLSLLPSSPNPPKVYTRNRHPSYPPCQRSPGSRPLPSPGGSSQLAHEIVTVGDPLLSSGLRSIGSRRHSTSSLSPQPRQMLVSPPLATMNQLALLSSSAPPPPLSSASRDLGLRDTEKGKPPASGVRTQSHETSSLSPGGQHSRHHHSISEMKTDVGKESAPGKQAVGENPKLSPTAPEMAGASQASPPPGTGVLTGHQRASSSSSSQVEKGKQGGKDPDLSAGVMLLSRHRVTTTLSKDKGGSSSNPAKEGSVTLAPASKDAGKLGSPQPPFHKSGGRKSQDYLSGPAPAADMKPLWSSEATAEEDVIKRRSQATPAVSSSHAVPTTKDKHSKVRNIDSRETCKEREKTPQNSNKNPNNAKETGGTTNAPTPTSQNSKAATLGNNTKTIGKQEVEKLENQGRGRSSKNRERFSSPEKNSSSLEAIKQPRLASERGMRASQVQARVTANEVAAARDKKRAIVKASLTPLKTDPNGTNTVSTSSDSCITPSICPAGQEGPPHRRSSCSMLFSPSARSESSESNSPPPHPEDCEEKRLLTHCTEDEGTSDRDDHALLEEEGGDGDKHHEDDGDCSGSAKRRYPRRSARARSNMFFGLTPFYGVRSYGEEDIPFYSSSGDGPGKRKAGGSRRSAEGQVDGADDRSTSSSGDSGEEEKGGFNQCSNKDPYYYNFTRTIINPGPVMPSIEGIDQCLGRGSQLQRFLKDEAEEEERVVAAVDEGVPTRSLLGHQQIGQLDGVDDSSESDASASTTNTTTTATAASSSHKSTGKRKGRERHAEKLEHDSGKEADNSSGGGGSSGSSSNNSREGRKSQKDNSLPLGGVKSSQGQDPLEAQLSLNTDLLKSDSDNNNSDDCGNILPSDIMEFVLNTPSMQALGQQPEASSSELLSLDEGYGVGVNRRKDILFEDFPQPLASAEHVESGVSTSISVEEPYGLPLELPSDLSVLTTRSPTVNNQNHGGLISEGSERTMLSLAASDETIAAKGGVDKQQSRGAVVSPESQQEGSGGSRESQVREGHMTPEQFEHINSPSLGQVVEAGNQDLTRSSGTPVLPSSPTLPLQGQKYIPAASSVSPGPSHVASTAVQTTSHLKPGPEKLIVVNQHLQPLYVLQTLPNGVTQKIQITPSVSATGVMDTMTLTTGLTTGITTSQPIFPAGGKVPHHPQIHTFTGTTQTGFQPGIPSTTSGLLIGVPSHEPQILVTEAGRRHDLAPNVTIVSSATSISTSSAVLASGHGKKRPISRLQSRKTKKLARSRSQPTLAPSEVRPNMTLINLSSPQMAQSGLVELGTLTTAATTSHRKVPNIIKRPKSGIMYFEPIQQRMPLPSGQPGILGHASSTHLLPCTVSGLNPNQSAVLNMVSMAQASGPGGLITPGSVSLSTPVLSSAEITGPISSLLFKASPHNLGLPEQQMLLQSGAPLMSQLCSPVQTSIASSICVLPSHQTISMSVSQQVDPESAAFQRQQHPPNASGQPVALAPSPVPQDSDKGHLVGVLSQSSSSQSSRTMPISRSSSEQKQELKSSATATSSTGSGKGKQKAKRTRQSPDKASGKKHKGWQAEPPREAQGDRATSTPGSREPVSPEPLDTGKPRERGTSKSVYSAKSAEPPALTSEFPEEKSKTTAGSLLVATPDQEGSHRDSSMDSKPKKGLIFEICSDDGFQIRCESIEEAWKSLTDKVQEARSNARLKELSFEGVNGLRMLGVLHDAVVFLLEQLYGSRHCRNYRFRFHRPEEADEPPINPHGSARAELHHRRSVFDMFNFLASKHRQPPEYNPHEEDEEVQLKSARRATSMDLPVPMRFRHLKRTSKEAVGVYRSAIHGRGLFCKRSIDVGEMVIEYSGNVIRSVLTDKREKYYDGKGVGCYMFRIDDYEVVDATVHGNAARFINHSCEPNCYSRVINVDGQKHIVIFATRKIYRGEELTYDYKFPIEEPGNKLPCNCGTKKCRKFLN